jgi:hypothetical protein
MALDIFDQSNKPLLKTNLVEIIKIPAGSRELREDT